MSEAELRAEKAGLEREKSNHERDKSAKEIEKSQKEAEERRVRAERAQKEAEMEQKKIEKANLERQRAAKERELQANQKELDEANAELMKNEQERSMLNTSINQGNAIQAELEKSQAELKQFQFVQDPQRKEEVDHTKRDLEQTEQRIDAARADIEQLNEQIDNFDDQIQLNERTQELAKKYRPDETSGPSQEEKDELKARGEQMIEEFRQESLRKFDQTREEMDQEWKQSESKVNEFITNFRQVEDEARQEIRELQSQISRTGSNPELERRIQHRIAELRYASREVQESVQIAQNRAMSNYIARLEEVERAYFRAMEEASVNPLQNMIKFIDVCNNYKAVIRHDCVALKADPDLIPIEIQQKMTTLAEEVTKWEKAYDEKPFRHFLEYCFAFENYVEYMKDICIGDPKEMRDMRHLNTKEKRLKIYNQILETYKLSIGKCEEGIQELHELSQDLTSAESQIDDKNQRLIKVQTSGSLGRLNQHMNTMSQSSEVLLKAAKHSQDALAVEQLTDVYKANAIRIKLQPYQVTIADAKTKGETINLELKRLVIAAQEIGGVFMKVVEKAKKAGIYDEELHERMKDVLEANKVLITQLYDHHSEDKYDAEGKGPRPVALTDVIVQNSRAYQSHRQYIRNFTEGITGGIEGFSSVKPERPKAQFSDDPLPTHSFEHLTRLKNIFGGFDDIYYNESESGSQNQVEHFGNSPQDRYEQIFGKRGFYEPIVHDSKIAMLLGEPTRFNPLGLKLTDSEIEAYTYIINIIGAYEEHVRYQNQNTVDYVIRSLEILRDMFEKKQKLRHQGYEVVLEGTIKQLETEAIDDPDLQLKVARLVKKKLQHQNALFELNTSISDLIRSLLSNLTERVKSLKKVLHVYIEVGYEGLSEVVEFDLKELLLPSSIDLLAIEQKYEHRLNESGMRTRRNAEIKQLTRAQAQIKERVENAEENSLTFVLNQPYKLKRMDNGALKLEIKCDTGKACLPITLSDGSEAPCERYRLPHIINANIDFVRMYTVPVGDYETEIRENLVIRYNSNVITDMESEEYLIQLEFLDLGEIQKIQKGEENITYVIENTVQVSKNIISNAVNAKSQADEFIGKNNGKIQGLGDEIVKVSQKSQAVKQKVHEGAVKLQETIQQRQRIKALLPGRIKRIEEMIQEINRGL